MGNRAVIATKNSTIGIYLHWNGGIDSVAVFLKYCELRGFRSPSEDNYGWARLCQVIANFFGGSMCIGIDSLENLDCDNGDNGMHIIGGWKVVGRKYDRFVEPPEVSDEDLLYLDSRQPESEQIGEYLKAEPIGDRRLNIGDEVVWLDWNGSVRKAKVVGFGDDRFINCRNVLGAPYVDEYGDKPEELLGNYLFGDNIRIAKSE